MAIKRLHKEPLIKYLTCWFWATIKIEQMEICTLDEDANSAGRHRIILLDLYFSVSVS